MQAPLSVIAKAVRADNFRQLTRATPHLLRLKGSRILMTGCSGLFGLWLLDLIDLGNRELGCDIQPVVLTRNSSQFAQRHPHLVGMPGLIVKAADIRSFKVGRIHPTHLIHAATTSAAETFSGVGPLDKFDTLVLGTRNLLSQFPRGCSLRSALFLSSGVVYGALPAGAALIREDFDCAPLPSDIAAALGHAKRAAEFLCHGFAAERDVSLRVARCFAFSGAGLPVGLHYALGDFMHQAIMGQPIVVKGDGTAMRSYMHLGDMAIWLLCLLADPERSRPVTVNVGSPQGMTIQELADEVSNCFVPKCGVIVLGGANYSVGNVVRARYVPDTKRASEFGLENWTPFRVSLENMLAGMGS